MVPAVRRLLIRRPWVELHTALNALDIDAVYVALWTEDELVGPFMRSLVLQRSARDRPALQCG
jgi:hypothetical protein